jgi:hypothetical protein
MAAVAVVVLTGVLNSYLELAHISDLWRLTYGRVILAKIVLLGLALVLAARHRWVFPKRLAGPAPAVAVAGVGPGAAKAEAAADPDEADPVEAFERSSRWEAVLLGLVVAFTAGLVVLVPGRTIALAASGPVNQTARTGGYTVQLYIDPTAVGANEVHVSFVTPSGLAAAEVATVKVDLTQLGSPPATLAMRLISPGHFVGDTTLPAPGRYDLSVVADTGTATFHFQLRSSKGAHT